MSRTLPALTENAEPVLEDVVLEDGLAHYLKRRWFSLAGNQFGALVLALPAWQLAGAGTTLCFLVGFTLLNIAILAVKAQTAGMPRSTATYRHRSRLSGASSGVLGAGLAAGNIYLHQRGGEAMLIYSVAVQAGVAAAGLGVSSFHLPALRCNLMFGLGLYLFSLGFVPSTMQVQVIGLGTTIALVFLLLMGQQQAIILASAIRLQHENDALVKQLARENSIATSARDAAQRANQQKSHFFASASHDLRQPVHALNLYASLLRESNSEKEHHEVLERIGNCVQSLDDLFESLLTVTRAESLDSSDIEFAPIPLDDVIRTVVNQAAPRASENGIQIRHCPTRAWVLGEKLTLERILSNLVANAVAFSAKGRVLVGVRRRGEQVELQVVDNGIGISEEQQELIFSEFYQADNPGRRSGQGFGLGLVIVQRLCTALGYALAVRSKLGKGSCFGVLLPRATATPPALLTRTDTHRLISSNLHALIVDDEESVRDAMKRTLEKWHVTATICASAEDAINTVRSNPEIIDCILADQRLGDGIYGVQLAKQLTALLPRPVPVAIITGETAGDWYENAQSLGFTVLFKPVKQIRLRAFLAAAGKKSDA